MIKGLEQIKKVFAKYGHESFIFDLTGIILILLFQRFFGKGEFIVSSFSPLVAVVLVYFSFLVIAIKMIALFNKGKKAESGALKIIIPGAYALMTIAQPVIITSMMLRFGILPNDFLFVFSFFVGLAVIFPAALGYQDEKPTQLLKYFGISAVAAFVFYHDLNWTSGAQGFCALFISIGIYLCCFLAYTSSFREKIQGWSTVLIELKQRNLMIRWALSLGVAVLMWIWWELAIDSISLADPGISLGKKLIILYFTGPLLYRISLMIFPTFSWIKLIFGFCVFLFSLYF